MSISVVNAWKIETASATSTGLTTLSGSNGTGTPSTGNTVVVAISSGNTNANNDAYTNHTVSDNNGGTWTRMTGCTSNTTGGVGYGCCTSIWYQVNNSGFTQVSVGDSTTENIIVGIIHEVSGLGSAPFTSGEYASLATYDSSVPTTIGSGSFNTATANSILFAAISMSNTVLPTMALNGTGSVPSSGWAFQSSTYSQETSLTYYPIWVPNIIVSSTQTGANHTWGVSNNAGQNMPGCVCALHVTGGAETILADKWFSETRQPVITKTEVVSY